MRIQTALISAAILTLTGCIAINADEEYTRTPVSHDTGTDSAGLGLPFSKAVTVGDIIFLSGELGMDSNRKLAPGGAGPETTQIFSNIEATLKRHGAGLKDIVKCSVFLEDMSDYTAMNEAYAAALPDPKPARSTFGVDGIALDANLEIECIAVRP